MEIKKTLEFLKKDQVRNINIINFIRNYKISTFDVVGDSVLIRGKSDEDWVYISSKSEEEFLQLISRLDEEDRCFAILEDWMQIFSNLHFTEADISSIIPIYEHMF
jgi:8-oxo-dGTP diphosphatase